MKRILLVTTGDVDTSNIVQTIHRDTKDCVVRIYNVDTHRVNSKMISEFFNMVCWADRIVYDEDVTKYNGELYDMFSMIANRELWRSGMMQVTKFMKVYDRKLTF